MDDVSANRIIVTRGCAVELEWVSVRADGSLRDLSAREFELRVEGKFTASFLPTADPTVHEVTITDEHVATLGSRPVNFIVYEKVGGERVKKWKGVIQAEGFDL